MNKVILTIAQNQELKRLGLDPCKASMYILFRTEDWTIIDHEYVAENHFDGLSKCTKEGPSLGKPLIKESFICQANDPSTMKKNYGVFTLQDLLDMIPPIYCIKIGDLITSYSKESLGNKGLNSTEELCYPVFKHWKDAWFVGYQDISENDTHLLFSNSNLIDACYRLVRFLATEKLL